MMWLHRVLRGSCKLEAVEYRPLEHGHNVVVLQLLDERHASSTLLTIAEHQCLERACIGMLLTHAALNCWATFALAGRTG